MTEEELKKLELVSLYLKNGTFTLRGVDATQFVELRIWLAQFLLASKDKKEKKTSAGIKKKTKKSVTKKVSK